MCGIIVANTKDKFYKTYESNKERGDFSFGCLFVKDKDIKVVKTKEYQDEDISKDCDFYLGHTRAPTINQDKEFDPDQSHPFEGNSWIVGHNGILKNFEELKAYLGVPVDIDSAILPYLFDTYSFKEALEQLKGIFGIWAYNKNTQEVFVARCGATLYYNKEENIISSAKIDNSEMLDEGIIYQWHKDKPITKLESFEYDSPYLLL